MRTFIVFLTNHLTWEFPVGVIGVVSSNNRWFTSNLTANNLSPPFKTLQWFSTYFPSRPLTGRTLLLAPPPDWLHLLTGPSLSLTPPSLWSLTLFQTLSQPWRAFLHGSLVHRGTPGGMPYHVEAAGANSRVLRGRAGGLSSNASCARWALW